MPRPRTQSCRAQRIYLSSLGCYSIHLRVLITFQLNFFPFLSYGVFGTICFQETLTPFFSLQVLAQQRAEQARLAAQQNTTNPDAPVDLTTFFSTLSSSLRRQVLSDMDDSMLAVLPPELAAEAQEMRLYMERHRSMLQERLFAQASAASLSGIIRLWACQAW